MYVRSRFSEARVQLRYMRWLSMLLSYIFHPLLMPTYLFAVLIYRAPIVLSSIPTENRLTLLLVICFATFFIPLFLVVTTAMISKRNFSWAQLTMDNRKERFFPFLLTGLYYLTAAYMVFGQLNPMLKVLMIGISSTVILLALISTFWKISAHAAGISGLIGLLLMVSRLFPTSDLFLPVVVGILLAGILFSARLFLNAHSPAQVLGGMVLGLVSGMGSVYLILQGS